MTTNAPAAAGAGGLKAAGQIFVLGRNRSGTKWLTNQLSNHPEVAAITGPGSGVLEANLFEHLPRLFGDLSIDDHYYAFLACFMKSSYFQRSGLPESVLFERRHDDYLGFFGYLMDRLAAERGTSRWLQKGNSLMLPALRAAFPQARFLIMRRTNVLDNVRSSIALQGAQVAGRNKPVVVARELASYYLHRGIEQQHVGRPNVHLVNYETMVGAKEVVLRQACEFLGLEFDAAMLEDRFPPNTSYKRAKRGDVMTRFDLRTFDLMQPVVRATPLPILRRLYQGRLRPVPGKGERVLMPGSFGTFRREIQGAKSATAVTAVTAVSTSAEFAGEVERAGSQEDLASKEVASSQHFASSQDFASSQELVSSDELGVSEADFQVGS